MREDRVYKSNFYGDETRWFIGVVEDNNDPMKLGRVRVRIQGLHGSLQENISTGDLPWAQTVVPTTEGGVSGIGRSSALLPGAVVYGLFLDGKWSQLPLILGSLPTVESAPGGKIGMSSSGQGVTGMRNKIGPTNVLGDVGGTNAETAFNFFVANGFTPQQAAGIVGNLMQESGPSLNTSIKAAGTEQSFGIAQWNAAAGRFQLLKEFASDLGEDWRTLNVQLRFILWELENYPYLGLSKLRAAQTIEEAVIAFQDSYERPSAPHTSGRIGYAKEVYNRMVS